MTRFAHIAVCAALLLSCRTRPYDEIGEPAPPPDAAACVTHSLVEVPTERIVHEDAPLVLEVGRAVRVRLTVRLREGCDLPADVRTETAVIDRSIIVRLFARVWRGEGCDGPVIEHTRVLVLSDIVGLSPSGSLLNVVDGPKNQNDGLKLPVLPASGPPDCAARPLDAGCSRDCQCQATSARARCIARSTRSVCAIPCTTSAECPDARPECRSTGAAPLHICTIQQLSPCCEGGCYLGEVCRACACRPLDRARDLRQCACDADCGFGRICESGRCTIPCATVADCPSGFDICFGRCDVRQG